MPLAPINEALAAGTRGQPEPQVGMGATILLSSDRHAATITHVLTKKGVVHVTVQEDEARIVKGSAHDGSAEYVFTPNPRGRIRDFRLVNGRWQQIVHNPDTKRWNKASAGIGLRIGHRSEYYDPSF